MEKFDVEFTAKGFKKLFPGIEAPNDIRAWEWSEVQRVVFVKLFEAGKLGADAIDPKKWKVKVTNHVPAPKSKPENKPTHKHKRQNAHV